MVFRGALQLFSVLLAAFFRGLLRDLGGFLRDLLAALQRLLAGLLARSITSSEIWPSFSSSMRVEGIEHAGEEPDRDRADGEPERVLLRDALGRAGPDT